MAGYCYEMGMSNNAVAAYCDGLVPASKIPGVPAALVKEHGWWEAWHHTSKAYNKTKFYDPQRIRAQFGLEVSEDHEPDPRAIAALAAWKANKGGSVIHLSCTVHWLEWTGTLSRPHCTERQVDGCRVEVKGQTATFTLPDGQVLKKRLTTRGFWFLADQGEDFKAK